MRNAVEKEKQARCFEMNPQLFLFLLDTSPVLPLHFVRKTSVVHFHLTWGIAFVCLKMNSGHVGAKGSIGKFGFQFRCLII